ncbi:hypothetical protein CV102_19505 [Natronococcus pandeyae]|uniref:Uncharacterized protein n=1 Tax=Natronococcus pandeyae TaxID=2055836 RepID=A0A8J8Q3E0_9EURY|nr:hypothetical protein [Natronococcus pandeyae]TYL36944.1 hypothetical protein CV102_19505 [Natronococcus pandeyae]
MRDVWRPAPLGYPVAVDGVASSSGIDPDAFAAAGGTVAGYTHGDRWNPGKDERLGMLSTIPHEEGARTGIQEIDGLLPSGFQRNGHPFGLLDYAHRVRSLHRPSLR